MNDFNIIGKIYFAPNTSDTELIEKAKLRLKENGIPEDIIEIIYNVQELNEGDLYMVIKRNSIKSQSFRIHFANTFCYSLSIVVLISFMLLFSNVYGFVLAGANSNMMLQIQSSSPNNTGDHMVMDHSQMDHMNMNMNQAEMLKRGDIAMEFNQSKISHQFIITPDGGQIKISALDNNDNQTVSQIKDHVRNIQKEFSEGNFNRSSFIHATTVPGTEVMTDKKDLIDYSITEMNNGSSLILKTNDTEVIDAINQFMEFQAIEHRGH